MGPLLEVHDLTLRRDDGTGSAILNDFNLQVEDGEVVILKGPSGCGKTTLLKCIAELNVYQQGEILLEGKKSTSYGIPNYRTLVQYVPQRPSLLPGTPLQFLERLQSFASRKVRAAELDGKVNKGPTPFELADEWDIDRVLWTRDWGTLSGGESQRIAMAVAVGMGGAEVLLLDEPTSALDEVSTKKVERTLLSMLPPAPRGASAGSDIPRRGNGPKALIWITHSPEQSERVGTRVVDFSHL
ncbi:uncharacterized protein EHS24_008356 [Apiotrichum porosum]|uniref:ABC transporter domain-containing protein n=1 Tax=Apiotrichum porosum TaxID=105984 RepID=A0A427XQ27_9TREE|nr:uncharacterized protein EHS24_008356 [Apiotrichum porosum]RSH80927.1 hypothetical protein EHS24_008356 [Apiotrichum porosum]